VDRDDAAVAAHPYAIRKKITHAAGAGRSRVTGSVVGQDADCIVVPYRTLAGELVGVECINAEGAKQTFGRKGVLVLGQRPLPGPTDPGARRLGQRGARAERLPMGRLRCGRGRQGPAGARRGGAGEAPPRPATSSSAPRKTCMTIRRILLPASERGNDPADHAGDDDYAQNLRDRIRIVSDADNGDDAPPEPGEALTEDACALAFKSRHPNYAYTPAFGAWHCYDPERAAWVQDTRLQHMTLMRALVRELAPDKLHKASAIAGAISLARSNPGVAMSADQWDADVLLLEHAGRSDRPAHGQGR
jgi:hypothetical protein